MRLKGSCRCGAVKFELDSDTPYPFNLCYCSICRKSAGGGGYAINIMGYASSLQVEGKEHLEVYRAFIQDELRPEGKVSSGQRHFCRHCGSALWLFDPSWPEWVYPNASAIDTPLPVPPERVHLMLDFKAPWVEVPPESEKDRHFPRYPEESIEGWHKKRGLFGG